MNEPAAENNWLRRARTAYLDSADRKIADLAEAIDQLEEHPTSAGYHRSLRTLLHNLVGSGASYGFPGISVVARRLSSALKRATGEQMTSDTDLISLLRAGLTELRQAFDRQRDELNNDPS